MQHGEPEMSSNAQEQQQHRELHPCTGAAAMQGAAAMHGTLHLQPERKGSRFPAAFHSNLEPYREGSSR